MEAFRFSNVPQFAELSGKQASKMQRSAGAKIWARVTTNIYIYIYVYNNYNYIYNIFYYFCNIFLPF